RDFPGRPVLRMSAQTGEGFELLCEFLDQQGEFGRRVMDVDYDVYAEGEAELGWLNSQVSLVTPEAIDLDAFLLRLIEDLRDELAAIEAETAHLKTIGGWEGYFGVANLISSFTAPALSVASNCKTKQANVVVNARVAVAPEKLAELVRASVAKIAGSFGGTATVDSLQSFRPGRPVPTHRILSP
ncbi:MAG TPA: cobalamin biosynthesis protein P47K, partial [Pirellulaceae bacterium]|nr:cobalamin biosynthesis protein P47K [Pirellulaceae bacterium]